MNKLIAILQETTHNSVSLEEATDKIIKIIPELSNNKAREIMFATKEYVVGHLNAVKLQEILKQNGLSDKIFARFK